MRVSVVGLGRLGQPLATLLAGAGHDVLGVDTNPAVVGSGFPTTIDAARVAETDATFIAVPTPSAPDGTLALDHVIDVVNAIRPALARKSEFHAVAITSTVMPGTTDGPIRAALGQRHGLCYCPEFVALDTVVADLQRPQSILIGEADEHVGSVIGALRKSVCSNDPPLIRTTPVNAEIAKLALNAFLTTKISFANMLSDICERVPGADVDVVTAVLGRDARVGEGMLRAATPYGGPCLPRDSDALARFAEQLGARAELVVAAQKLNDLQLEHLAQLVLQHLPEGGTAGVLGLSYKAGTDVVTQSAGLDLVWRLHALGVPVAVYDPASMATASKALPDGVTRAASTRDCVACADVVVVATLWPEFAVLTPEAFAGRESRPAVIDCWRLLPANEFGAVADMIHLGRG